MSVTFVIVIVVLAIAQVTLPRRLAFLPLVVAGLNLGNVEILPQLTSARLLIILGIVRAISGGYFTFSFRNTTDVWFSIFSVVLILSTAGHDPSPYIPSPLNARLGLVLNIFGCYLYGRAFLPDVASIRRYAAVLAFSLVPLALFMGLEFRTGSNAYYSLGARSERAMSREGRIRAQGPFQHPILAGTAGATAIPLALLLWHSGRRRIAIVGLCGALGVVLACASSGPLAAVAVTIGAAVFWRRRRYLKHVLWTVVALAVVYNIIKGRGPWYLMASIDLVGGSTGWHRAKLIDQGVKYLGEWWLYGTDYTRHWMASGVRWNPNMVDLTNYYLHLGVTAGLGAVICLFGIIVSGFRKLYGRLLELRAESDPAEFTVWCVGTALATHVVSFVSISYFDQMYVFFYLLVGAIPGVVATIGREEEQPPA